MKNKDVNDCPNCLRPRVICTCKKGNGDDEETRDETSRNSRAVDSRHLVATLMLTPQIRNLMIIEDQPQKGLFTLHVKPGLSNHEKTFAREILIWIMNEFNHFKNSLQNNTTDKLTSVLTEFALKIQIYTPAHYNTFVSTLLQKMNDLFAQTQTQEGLPLKDNSTRFNPTPFQMIPMPKGFKDS